ncbi:AAA family ATPase [Bacillus sp. RAR_GA_16]|uniref:AAA family ATPase n=1 Tax=Bacillus sp. RAR_GA_16 TaxID=2876774 RepID=UPI001CC9CF15|nr:AAA family ATPase [Bacillus sp. RAR_GA_16]MCA0173474.1 AAA family ATPase [Bacillus sp. RAR_GA_16]
MKLNGVEIYGFGKFENEQIQNISDELHLVFGENEAGKSTLIAFIEYVLFGFKARQDNNYNMNNLPRFGGVLSVEVNEESLRIERTKDLTSEQVVIYYSNGTYGDRDDLKALLNGMNRTSFRQIFFCDLTTLNEYQTYDEDSWNQILYEAGMSGGASLLAIEKNLDKWQGEIFKPGGRKPLLNEKLEIYESLKKRTSDWEKKNASYNQLIKKVEELERKIEKNTEELQSLQSERRTLDYEKQILPLLKEKQQLHQELQSLPDSSPFPEEGLARMDKWKEQAVLLSGELESLKKRMQALKEGLHPAHLLPNWREFLQEASYLNEEMILYRARTEEHRKRKQEIYSVETTLERELQELGQNEEMVDTVKTPFSGRQSLKQLKEAYQQSDQKYQYVNDGFLTAKDELEKEENEYNRLKDRMASEKVTEKEERESSSTKKRPFGMVALAMILLIIIGLVENWLLGFLAAAIVIAGAFLMNYTTKGSKNGFHDEILIRKKEWARQAEQVKDQVDRLNRTYLKAAEKVDLWEAERYQLDKELAEWRAEHRFPDDLQPSSLLEAFDRMVSIKRLQTERNQKQRQVEELEASLTVVEERMKHLCEKVNLTYQTPEKAIQLVLQKAEEQREILKETEIAKNRLKSLEEQSGEVKAKLQSCKEEMNALMQFAETASEEAFRIKGKANQEAKELKRQLDTLSTQLGVDASVRFTSIEEIEHQRQLVEQKEVSVRDNQQALYKQVASEQEKIRLLIEDGTYDELLLQRQQTEDEMNTHARRWSVMRIAADLLTKAKAKYQEERLPAVMKKAETYFKTMTDGRYVAIYPPSDGEPFRVIHHSGRAFKPSELSRGTAEQLYLCIRLALASVATVELPIILDDIFVNFDEKRTNLAKTFIKQFSKEHQVILLTCHSATTVGLEENIHVLERSSVITNKRDHLMR